MEVGDACYAMGNPFLLASDFHPTVTHGIVSGIHRYQYPSGTLLEYADCLQTDASINPGNSGGPLFDAAGRLIGINGRASFEKRGRVNVGIAYAISINQIQKFLGRLKSGRIVDHATLGAVVGSDADRRTVVTDILDSSDAYRRGLRYGDEIVTFAGRPIHSANGFKNVLGTLPKGWRVPLSYRRDGKRYDVLVRLAGVHTEEELLAKLSGGARPAPMPIPKPGEKPLPEGEKPQGRLPEKGPRDEERPRRGPLPDDGPAPAIHPKVPMPEIVKEHFQEKRGYANYHYNRLNRDRVWKSLVATADFGSGASPWTLAGPLESGGRYRFEIGENEVSLKLPSAESKWTATDEISQSSAPAGSGGLFAALYLWRRLAVVGPERFGEVYYLGTAPLVGQTELADVLVGLHGPVKCYFYFDVKSGLLLAVEMFLDENADPCEVYFSDYRRIDGRNLPQRLEVRYGDERFGVFKIDAFSFDKPMQP